MKKLLFYLVLLIPVLNGLATATTGYFPPGTLNPGTIRAVVIGIPLIIFIVSYYPMQNINLLVLGYTSYLLFLVFLSSDILWSFYMYIKVAIGFLMFPLGYYFIRTKESFKLLMLSFTITLVLLLINILISNIFRLGSSDYLAESFYFGAGRVNITTSMLILVLVSPVTLHFYKGISKRVLIILFLAGLLVALVGIKRSVILTAIAAPVVYGLFTKYKKRLIKSLLLITLLLGFAVLIVPKYYAVFTDRLQARQESGSLEVSEEALGSQARFSEYNLVIETWEKGSLKHKLIGSEWLNDMYFFKAGRMLHTDYMVLLNGSGLIGFVIWFILLFMIFTELKRYHTYLRDISFFNDLFAVAACLMAAQLIMSISGSLYSIDVRSLFMLFWGAALGLMRQTYIEKMPQINSVTLHQ